MRSEIIGLRLAISPGRHDFLGLREFVKEFMQRLYSVANCSIVADFGYEKFALGSKDILAHMIPKTGPFETGIFFSIAQEQEEQKPKPISLYESCELTIVVKRHSRALVVRLVDELRERLLTSGSRVEESPLVV